MLLTITTTHTPATDLGFLLQKNPARLQTFPLSFGKAHVFYPEAKPERCTVALLLDVDPVGLVRRPRGEQAFALAQYTNDRPYVASSFLSVAISRVFGSALNGRSKDRPDLADSAISLEARLSVVPCRRGGEAFLRRLFEPLGYEVQAEGIPLDSQFSDWGSSPYFHVTLRGKQRLCDLLSHLYVLIPVLDTEKHYWVGDAEVEKLLKRGQDWLADHPARDEIVPRYLRGMRSLSRQALCRLTDNDADEDNTDTVKGHDEERLEARISLNELRTGSVLAEIKNSGAGSVIDLGCGEGRLLKRLFADRSLNRIVGMDVSMQALERAAKRLKLEQIPDRQRQRIELIQGSLAYKDDRLSGFDVACAVEVVEHLDPSRLGAFERVLFEFARPRVAVLTTPNREYNVRFEHLAAGKFRHRDHRFEWSREEFETWAKGVAARHGYSVRFVPVGEIDVEVGAPTQMGVFFNEGRDS